MAWRARLLGGHQPDRPPPALELIDRQAMALAGAISDTSDLRPQIARLQGIALAGVYQIIIGEAGARTVTDRAKPPSPTSCIRSSRASSTSSTAGSAPESPPRIPRGTQRESQRRPVPCELQPACGESVEISVLVRGSAPSAGRRHPEARAAGLDQYRSAGAMAVSLKLSGARTRTIRRPRPSPAARCCARRWSRHAAGATLLCPRLGLELLEHRGVVGGSPLLEDAALVIHHEDVEQLPDDLAPVGLQRADR